MQVTTRPPVKTLVADAALAAVVTAAMVVGTHGAAVSQVPPRHPLDALTFVLIGVAALGLAVRRVWPLVALTAVVGAAAVYLAVGYPYGPLLVAVLISLYTVAIRYPVRSSLAAYALAAAVLTVPVVPDVRPNQWFLTVVQLGVWFGAGLTAWALGTAVRTIRESAQRTRAEQARQRAYEERLRTAQDVHDIVGHGLAAISLQAGVALHVLDRSPGQAREILETIKESSQDALGELRATLAVFRAPDNAGDRGPVPGLDRLEVLVSRTTDSGVPVELVRTGQQVQLPASVDRAAYRIVQESLTNVLRHAGQATATVRVGYGPDELTLEIADTGCGPDGDAEAGQGLAGMRARAVAVGGSVDAGPGAAGGFVVRARLPVGGQQR